MRPLRKRPSRKRLKKLEGGWDSRNVKQEQILGKYDALTDDYCVFARGDSFRKHLRKWSGPIHLNYYSSPSRAWTSPCLGW